MKKKVEDIEMVNLMEISMKLDEQIKEAIETIEANNKIAQRKSKLDKI